MEPLRSPMIFFNHSFVYFMINKIHRRFIFYYFYSIKY